MPIVNITDEADKALRSASGPELGTFNGNQLPDGTWNIYLSNEAFSHLQDCMLPDETYSDACIRLTRKLLGKKPS